MANFAGAVGGDSDLSTLCQCQYRQHARCHAMIATLARRVYLKSYSNMRANMIFCYLKFNPM